jgi:hypothetical protein
MSTTDDRTIEELVIEHQQALAIAAHLLACTSIATAAEAVQLNDSALLRSAKSYDQAAGLACLLLLHAGITEAQVVAHTEAVFGLTPTT